MGKRLNTETKLNKNGFKIKVGTTNRLKPNTVYIDLGGYIIPQKDKNNYDEDVVELNKMFNKRLKSYISKSEIYDKKYICVIETAQARMKKGKKSYISMQCHLKQNGNFDTNDIIEITKDFTVSISKELSDIIECNGFSIKN
jgi:hypothetical protein